MSRTSLGLLFAGLCCSMGLVASSAAAAGAPVVGDINYAEVSITHTSVKGTANPNGAATTVKLEYREEKTGAEWKTLLTKEIGSGTSSVPFSMMVNGLKPQLYYAFRVSATNSYGTTQRENLYETQWQVLGNAELTPANFASSGTFELNYKVSGIPLKLACKESGYGRLGSSEGVGDNYHMTGSSCVYYQSGEAVCNANSVSFATDGVFNPTSKQLNLRFCPGEEVEHPVTFSEPFFVTVPLENWAVTNPWTLTTPVFVGAQTGTMTISTEAHLTGADSGKKYGVAFE